MSYEVLSPKNFTKQINDLTYTDYYYRLMLLAKSVFEWKNLPNGLDEKWIERYLFVEGKCMFYKDDTLGFMVAKCNASGNLNYFDEPTQITPYATNLTMQNPRKTFTAGLKPDPNKQCVLIRNNDDMIPTYPTIQLFALRLAHIARAIDVNIHAQKTPVLIKCSDKQRLSLKQVYAKWDGNEPVIYGDKSLDTSAFEVLRTDAPIVFDKLQIQRHEIWNEACTFLGINNTNFQKRERLTVSEVDSNNEQIAYSAQIMLKARERAVEQINELFGLNISVALRDTGMIMTDPMEGRIYPKVGDNSNNVR